MVGEKLKKLRIERALTINQVADMTGITVRSLSAYERGERIPSDERKYLLSNLYKKSIQEIFFDTRYTNSELGEWYEQNIFWKELYI